MAKRYWRAYRDALGASEMDPIETMAQAHGVLADALQPLVPQLDHPGDRRQLQEALYRVRRARSQVLEWIERER